MNSRQNPLFWSFGIGHWFGVHVRVSWLFPVLLPWFLYEFGIRLGVAAWGVLAFSVLMHEFGHILAARAMDGSGDEILLWPLGGLATVDVSSSPRAQMVAIAGGPFMNLLLCGLFLPAVLASDYTRAAFNPLALPIPPDKFAVEALSRDLQVVFFSVNWILLMVNLFPALPLDGGQMLRVGLQSRMGTAMGSDAATKIALGAGLLVAFAALIIFKHVVLLALAFLIILLAILESMHIHSGESYDESFMGYDFSQGYTSLERSSTEQRAPETRPGVLQRWLERRRLERQKRIEEQQVEAEQRLDSLLAKVHEQGMNALTPAERRMLKRASDRYRSKGPEQPNG